MQVDEKRIQEIVDKVLLRLSPEAMKTPAEAVMKAAETGKPSTGTSQRPGGFVPPHLRQGGSAPKRAEVRIPKGSHGEEGV